MSLSEKFEKIKFTKSVAGYAQKEVDGFFADILPLLREQEELIGALRAKLGAFEGKSEEIRENEQKAYKLLEAAKEEAQIIVATANKKAEEIAAEARVASEVQVRAASAHAAEVISKAEKDASAHIDDANAKAEKIITTADAKGRELLEKVKAIYAEEERKAKALTAECVSFEERFRTLVSETAKALAKMKEETPVPYESAKKAENTPPKEVLEEKEEPKTEETVTDVEFAGGRPVVSSAKREESHRRRLYDSVDIKYEEDEEDFSKIRDIMKGNGVKSQTHFSE